MHTHPKIAIIGGTIWGNRGAEAMLTTTIGRIKQNHPDAEFSIFSYYPAQDHLLVTDPSIQVFDAKPLALIFKHFLASLIYKLMAMVGIKATKFNFLRTADALHAADFLLDIGGITFSDGREKFLPYNILTIWPAMILGTPVIKLAQAVGPFHHTVNRLLAKYFLSRCKKIFARGAQSTEHIADLRLPEGLISIAADIAFLYENSFSLSVENADLVSGLTKLVNDKKKAGKKIVVITPSILVNDKQSKEGKDYIDLIFSALADLNQDEYFFVFAPNATREGSPNKHNNDILLITEMQKRLVGSAYQDILSNQSAFIDFDINTASIRAIVGQADLLLTSRYHAMISGLALCIPTVVIGWSHKYDETMQAFDLDAYSENIAADDLKLSLKIGQAINDRSAIKAKMNKTLPTIRAQSQQQFQYLDEILP